MLQIAFVVVLAVLWALTMAQPGGTDFLRVRVVQIGTTVIRTIDLLTGMAIVGLMVTMRGPLALTAGALLILWILTLFGVPQVQGVALPPLIVMIIVIGTTVHIVTHRSR